MDIASSSLASKPSNKNGRISWPEAPSMKQYFSLPDSVIYYITKNPSTPEVYLKMAKSCKYFFEKNPIIVAARIHNYGMKICLENNKHECGNLQCCARFDEQEISYKIWLTKDLDLFLFRFNSNFIPSLVPKIYRCEKAVLKLKYTDITLKDFQLLGSKFEKYYLASVDVTDNDDNPVMLDKVLESITNVKEFFYSFNTQPSAANALTMKNILKLQNLGNLRYIHLQYVPEVFNVKDLEKFIMKLNNTKIYLRFAWNISDGYNAQLDHLIDVVIASDLPNRVIIYNGQNEEKLNIMNARYQDDD